jgi:hypothetical protein
MSNEFESEKIEELNLNSNENIYNVLISLKEKNNHLLIQLHEVDKFKQENCILKNNLKELEVSCNAIKEENK